LNDYGKRVIAPSELEDLRRRLEGKRVVFTNGCFDLVHRGHVDLLEKARGFGDCLVVGINSDSSVGRLKGKGRPLTGQDDRAFILLHLESVDYITIFNEDTPLEVIKALAPDVLVKGAEYGLEDIVGAEQVLESGGEVKRVEMLEGYSTSGLIDKLKG